MDFLQVLFLLYYNRGPSFLIILDDINKIDLSIVKRLLKGNPSQAQKLITYNPSIKFSSSFFPLYNFFPSSSNSVILVWCIFSLLFISFSISFKNPLSCDL